MNTYHVLYRNRLLVTRVVEFTIAAPSRKQAVARAKEHLLAMGKNVHHFMRPEVGRRGEA